MNESDCKRGHTWTLKNETEYECSACGKKVSKEKLDRREMVRAQAHLHVKWNSDRY